MNDKKNNLEVIGSNNKKWVFLNSGYFYLISFYFFLLDNIITNVQLNTTQYQVNIDQNS